MKKHYLIIVLLIIAYNYSIAQSFIQYFDGADTSKNNSLIIKLDTAKSNIWQIGRPQKIIFYSAATKPNAIVTDTTHDFPVNNISRFTFSLKPVTTFGMLAIQWIQKIDMNPHHDGGIIEFSVDTGKSWENVFNNPHVYNVTGYPAADEDTLLTGEYAFSNTDTTWRNVWVCLDLSWLSTFKDSILFRYTFKSDTIHPVKEGWMIDNMRAQTTVHHPVKEVTRTDYMRVYPNPANGIVYIDIHTLEIYHIIEHMELVDSQGKTVKQWKNVPTKFWFDSSSYPDGVYILNVTTNLKTETVKLIFKKTAN
jgi:hypothetical protein